MEKQSFDFEAFKKQAATRVKNRETLLGKECVLTPLLKEVLERALEGELEVHVEESEEASRKNGKGKKKIKTRPGKTTFGGIRCNPIHIPFDRLCLCCKTQKDQ